MADQYQLTSIKDLRYFQAGCILYRKEYSSDLPVINSLKKGSKISIDTPNLQPSTLDGIIIQFKYNKDALDI